MFAAGRSARSLPIRRPAVLPPGVIIAAARSKAHHGQRGAKFSRGVSLQIAYLGESCLRRGVRARAGFPSAAVVGRTCSGQGT